MFNSINQIQRISVYKKFNKISNSVWFPRKKSIVIQNFSEPNGKEGKRNVNARVEKESSYMYIPMTKGI